jgi:hypothetical protein
MDLRALNVALLLENTILTYANILAEVRRTSCHILEDIDRDERSAAGLLSDIRSQSLSLANRR